MIITMSIYILGVLSSALHLSKLKGTKYFKEKYLIPLMFSSWLGFLLILRLKKN